jgi:hypothetical protein
MIVSKFSHPPITVTREELDRAMAHPPMLFDGLLSDIREARARDLEMPPPPGLISDGGRP